jgi:hypothetical protein
LIDWLSFNSTCYHYAKFNHYESIFTIKKQTKKTHQTVVLIIDEIFTTVRYMLNHVTVGGGGWGVSLKPAILFGHENRIYWNFTKLSCWKIIIFLLFRVNLYSLIEFNDKIWKENLAPPYNCMVVPSYQHSINIKRS